MKCAVLHVCLCLLLLAPFQSMGSHDFLTDHASVDAVVFKPVSEENTHGVDHKKASAIELQRTTEVSDGIQRVYQERANKELKQQDDYERMTVGKLIHEAAARGDVDLVKELLDKGAEVDDKDVYLSMTPLHYAAMYERVETIKVLLDRGAYIDAWNIIRSTPLHLAAEGGGVETVKVLLDRGADISAEDMSGYSSLHYATMHGNVEVIKVLLDRGADIESSTDDGLTPLHVAASFGQVESVKALLDEGASKSAEDQKGRTPYDVTCSDPNCYDPCCSAEQQSKLESLLSVKEAEPFMRF